MTSVYDIIDKIKVHLRNHPIVNHVTFGDVTKVDLNKTMMYPLTHFTLDQAVVTENSIQFRLSFLFIDIVDYSKDFNTDDFGNRQDDTNLLDVYNTQLQVANDLISQMKRGQLHQDEFHVLGDPICRPFADRFENELAGWSVNIDIVVPNNLSIC